jgi:hypothetical protein
MHNPNTWATQNYIIVEDLAQAPCAMFSLEVLQSFPMQWKYLLSSIGGVDPSKLSLMTFVSFQVTPRLSHHVSFQVIVQSMGKNIYRTMVDGGASTWIICISCWKSLDSPKLYMSVTLLKEFDGNMFQTHGTIIDLPIDLGGKNFLLL